MSEKDNYNQPHRHDGPVKPSDTKHFSNSARRIIDQPGNALQTATRAVYFQMGRNIASLRQEVTEELDRFQIELVSQEDKEVQIVKREESVQIAKDSVALADGYESALKTSVAVGQENNKGTTKGVQSNGTTNVSLVDGKAGNKNEVSTLAPHIETVSLKENSVDMEEAGLRTLATKEDIIGSASDGLKTGEIQSKFSKFSLINPPEKIKQVNGVDVSEGIRQLQDNIKAEKRKKAGVLGVLGLQRGVSLGKKAIRSGADQLNNPDMSKTAGNTIKKVYSAPFRFVGRRVGVRVENVALRGVKKAGGFLVRSFKKILTKVLQAARALFAKLVAVFGSGLVLLAPVLILLLCVGSVLGGFMGNEESQKSYTDVFAAEQSEFNEILREKQKELSGSITSSPPDISRFPGISEEEYDSLIRSQYRADTTDVSGVEDIDFAAQLAIIQVMSGGKDLTTDTAQGDIAALVKYWMDSGVAWKFEEPQTEARDYEVTWFPSHEIEGSVEAETAEEATKKAKKEVKEKLKELNVNVDEQIDSIKFDKPEKIEGDQYGVSYHGSVTEQEEMSTTLTQNITSISYTTGTLDDYIAATEKAMQNNDEILVDFTYGAKDMDPEYISLKYQRLAEEEKEKEKKDKEEKDEESSKEEENSEQKGNFIVQNGNLGRTQPLRVPLEGEKLERAGQIYATFKSFGMDDNQIAGAFGNFEYENGGLDWTTVETIFDEPYTMGPRKKAAEAADFLITAIDPGYAATYPAIYRAGIGIGSWTDCNPGQSGYNTILRNYAESKGMNWYDGELQMAFYIDEKGEGYGQQLRRYMEESKGKSAQECGVLFQAIVEGVPGHHQAGVRGASAQEWLQHFNLVQAHADESFAKKAFQIAETDGLFGSDSGMSFGYAYRITVSPESEHYKKHRSVHDLLVTKSSEDLLNKNHEFKSETKAQIRQLYDSDEFKELFTGGDVGFGDGALEDGPQFDPKIWIEMNPFEPGGWRGQCTWFAWARAYEIYGFDIGARGDGRSQAGEVLRAHPDKFTPGKKPEVGAIYSFTTGPYGHVGIVVAVNGNQLTLEDGNFDGQPWNYPWPQGGSTHRGWKKWTVDMSWMTSHGAIYANPKESPVIKSGKSISRKKIEKKLASMKTPSMEELKSLAKRKYGMDEQAFVLTMGWIVGEYHPEDMYWSYLCACCPINKYLKVGGPTFASEYTSWGAYYSYGNYLSRAASANTDCKKLMYLALTQRDQRAVQAHGVVVENGYGNGQSISDAFYSNDNLHWGHALPKGGMVGAGGIWDH